MYINAFKFFKKRKLLGIKLLKKKRLTKAVNDIKIDVSNIHLDSKEHKDVPVYDTYNKVQKKIRAFLC
jgi:hypothetical protein